MKRSHAVLLACLALAVGLALGVVAARIGTATPAAAEAAELTDAEMQALLDAVQVMQPVDGGDYAVWLRQDLDPNALELELCADSDGSAFRVLLDPNTEAAAANEQGRWLLFRGGADGADGAGGAGGAGFSLTLRYYDAKGRTCAERSIALPLSEWTA